MVEAVRRGASIAGTAARFKVARATVRLWVERAVGRRLDRLDWSDGLPGRREPVNRTPRTMEDKVLTLRTELRETGDLGDFGAQAIRAELLGRESDGVPSVRTIGRILERRGALDGRRRVRRPPPPRGWYLTDVAEGDSELDAFDIVEGLVIEDGPEVEVLTGISLHGGLAASWPMLRVTARSVVQAMIHHWRAVGCPAYAQFDNDTRFQGPHQYPDTLGRVTRLCLSLGVIPVFVPPREPGFQASIENFNGQWQTKVWSRFHHDSLLALQNRSTRYVNAWRERSATRIETAPGRRPFPKGWHLNLPAAPEGRLIFLRRTNETGAADLLGHTFPVDPMWPHRLVRAEVDLHAETISFFALRRRNPGDQRLLKTVRHKLPLRLFRD